MKITRVGNRGVIFTFYELDLAPYNCIFNVYAIMCKNHYYICDTYLGEYYMKSVTEHLESNYGKKGYVYLDTTLTMGLHGHITATTGNRCINSCNWSLY